MKIYHNNNNYVLSLNKGEKIIESIKEFVTKEKVGFAQISMIGAVSNVKIGYIPKGTTNYKWKDFTDQYELISGNGNVCWNKKTDEPIVHCHVSIANDQYQTFSGHMLDADVAVLGEVILHVISAEKVYKQENEAKLNIFQF